MSRKQYFLLFSKMLCSMVCIFCLYASSLAQDQSNAKVKEISEKAENLIASNSEACINQGKQIYEGLLLDKEIDSKTLIRGYFYERIGYANDKLSNVSGAMKNYKLAADAYEKSISKTKKYRKIVAFYYVGKSSQRALSSKEEEQEGITYLLKALALARQSPEDEKMQNIILNTLSKYYFYRRKPRIALKYDKQALSLSQKLKDTSKQSVSMAHIAWDYFIITRNNKKKSLDYFRKSLELSRKGDNKNVEADILDNLGLFCSNIGNLEDAERYYNQALTIYENTNNKSQKRQIYLQLAYIFGTVDREKAASYQELYDRLYEEAESEPESRECDSPR